MMDGMMMMMTGLRALYLAALAITSAVPAFALWGSANLLAAPPVPVGTTVYVEFEGVAAPLAAHVVKALPGGRLTILGRFEGRNGYVLFSGEMDAGEVSHERVLSAASLTKVAIVIRGQVTEFRAARIPPDARLMSGPLPRAGSAGR